MPEKTLFIPTLNDSTADFKQLFSLWSQANDCVSNNTNIWFDFTNCHFLRPNAVAFLGGLARLIESRNGTALFKWDTLKDNKILTNLCQNGFAKAFDHSSQGWDGNSIPYREDQTLDMNKIMNYLTYKWLGKGWVHVSDKLQDAIAGRMWEIYNNAFEHSNTQIGVFSCGQYFQKQNELILTVVDFGQGIPATVRTFLREHVDEKLVSKLTDTTCLKWAFELGNSTCTGGVARGLGLDLLKEFVRVNQGKLEVYSNGGYALIDRNGECFQNRTASFDGTVFHLTLRCTEYLYKLASETNGNTL